MNAEERTAALLVMGNLIDDLGRIAGDPVMRGLKKVQATIAGAAPIEEKPSIIGRERAIIDELAKKLLGEASRFDDTTKVMETRRGCFFEVDTRVAGERTGRVVRVTVELDRVEDVR